MATLITTALIGLFALSGGGVQAFAQTTTAHNPTYTVSMTAYNAVPEQTDSSPETTASGAYSNPEIVAARSQDLADELPYGTVIQIGAATSSPNCGLSLVGGDIGLRVVADSMHSRMQNKVDVLFAHKKTALELGICKDVQITVVGQVDIKHMPKTQAELQAQLAVVQKADAQPLAIFR
jgi:3D (Asp-Asp-Asp) domain-containing protein